MAATRSAVRAFTDHCEWTGATATDRENWLKERRAGVGGSDAAALIGYDDYKSPLALYADKTDQPIPDEQSEQAAWGLIFEPAIIKEFAQRTGRRVVRAGKLLRSKRAAHHQVTLDGVILSRPPEALVGVRGPGVLEVKTTGYGREYTEDLPVRVQIQMQWQLFVTGAEWGTCVWLPFPERKLQWMDVLPDREFQAHLASEVDKFWHQHVTRRIPPNPDDTESAALAIRAMYPDATEKAIRIEGALPVVDEFERVKAAIELLEKRKRLIRNLIAFTMGDAKYALLDDGRYFGASYYKARERRCPHCTEVLSKSGSYKTYALREPRKKPFHDICAVRSLPQVLTPEEEASLISQLEASMPAANDDTAAASGGEQ